jgi:hypothetical protein
LWYYSEQFDNAEWLKTELTVTANSVISPDGTQNADKITDTTANNEHRIRATSSLFIITTATTLSIFAKAAEYTRFAIANLSSSEYVKFNLSTGSVISTGANFSNAKIENYGNGWYRLSATTSTSGTYGYGLLNDAGDFTFTGTGTKGVYIWGAQAELGSYATSYIPTTSAAVTRNADVLTRAGFGNTSTSGTLFFDLYAENIVNPNGQYMLQLFAGSSIGDVWFADANGLSIIGNGSAIQIFNNGYSQQVQTFTPTQGQRVKIAIRYNGTNVSSAINGTLSSVFADTAVGVKNALRINNGENSTHAFNAVAFFPSYLTNDQLTALTTI